MPNNINAELADLIAQEQARIRAAYMNPAAWIGVDAAANGRIVPNWANARAVPVYEVAAVMNNRPEIWDRLLYAVSEIYETDCIIAGGAVRDYLLGLPAKDIDIFVNHVPSDDAILKAEELGWGRVHQAGDPGRYGNAKALGVIDACPNFVGGAVQLIFKLGDNPGQYENDIVSKFDLDIVKSSYYNGRIEDTDMAKTDRDNKTVTFCGDGDPKQSFDRADRFVKRAKEHGQEFKMVGFKKMEDIIAAKVAKAAEKAAGLAKLKKERW